MSDTNDTDKDVNKTDSESSGEQKVPEVSFESIKDNKGVSLEIAGQRCQGNLMTCPK